MNHKWVNQSGSLFQFTSAGVIMEPKILDGMAMDHPSIYEDVNGNITSHSRESGNPEMPWIPEPAPYLIRGQAWNDKLEKFMAL